MPEDLSNHPPGEPSGGPAELDRLRAFLSERSPEAAGFVKNNVGIDRYDARLFAEVLDAEAELRSIVNRAGKGAPKTFGPLLLDVFASFYKMVPALVDQASVDPAHLRSNRPFVERLREDEETMIARLDTATDEVASALATVEAGRRILEELARRPGLRNWMDQQAEPRHEDPKASGDQPAPEENATDSPGGPTESDANDDVASAAREKDPVKDVAEQAPSSPHIDVPDDASDGFAADLRALVRAASRAGSSQAGAHAAVLRDWRLKPADLRTVPLGERLEIARKLRTKRMRDLADLLGRMRNHRRAAERRKLKANRDESHGIETSGEIGRALPSEIAGAFGTKNPHRKRDFYRRLSERSVLSYSLRTDEPIGRGPVIAMIDSSGSMNEAPMEWACAIALALAHAATGRAGTGARRVHAIFFNAQVVRETELAPGERDVRKFLNIGSVDAAGGTDYVPPISRALEILSAGSKPDEGAADLLLVTDGTCRLPEVFSARLREEKSARGFRLVSVLVGDHADPATLETFSDKILRADDLARASGARDAAGELFESL